MEFDTGLRDKADHPQGLAVFGGAKDFADDE
jgi:hypothetical protein